MGFTGNEEVVGGDDVLGSVEEVAARSEFKVEPGYGVYQFAFDGVEHSPKDGGVGAEPGYVVGHVDGEDVVDESDPTLGFGA